MIKTVFFDLDETLLDDERTALSAQAEACRWAAEQRPGLDADRLQAAYHSVSTSFWRSYDQRLEQRSGDEIRRDMWQEGLADCHIHDAEFAEAVSWRYHAMRGTTYELFPDAMGCLLTLRRRYSLGLITNGASSLQRAKVSALDLDSYVDCVIIAGEVGVSKPDAAIFQHALALAGCEANEAAMVGDLLDRDVLGALNSGLLPIWINRTAEQGNDGLVPATHHVNGAAKTPPPQHVITSLDELPALLESIG